MDIYYNLIVDGDSENDVFLILDDFINRAGWKLGLSPLGQFVLSKE